MGSVERFRSGTTRSIGVAAMAVAVAALGVLVIDGAWDDVLRLTGPLGLVALFGYAGLWQPFVEISDGGIEIRNVLRTVRVPWPAVLEVDGRYGLRLRTAYGTVTAWAAPAPAGRERMTGIDSEASQLVRQRQDRLRELGHLDDARLESDRLDVTWHFGVMGAAACLAALSGLAALT